VQGCDASILLDDVGSFVGEKTAFPKSELRLPQSELRPRRQYQDGLRGFAYCFYPLSIFKSTPTSNGEDMSKK
jgi:hypothetical protein